MEKAKYSKVFGEHLKSKKIDYQKQVLIPQKRSWYTLVEWGGNKQ